MREVCSFLEKQRTVEKVAPPDSDDQSPVAHIRGIPVHVFPANYDFQKGTVVKHEFSPESVLKYLESEAAVFKEFLENDSCVFASQDDLIFINKSKCKALQVSLRQSRSLPLLQSECVINEVIGHKTLSRLLALSYSKEPDAIDKQLEQYLETRK
jgi:hypothetical protein